MSDSMIERVARASFKFWRERMTAQGRLMDAGPTFDDMDDSEREFALLHARAVIEAMREPTEAMLEEGFSEGRWECSFGVNGESAEMHDSAPLTIWEAMVDAAIAEPKP